MAVLPSNILDAGGPNLKKQQATCERVLADLNAAEKQLKAAKFSLSSTEKAAAKAHEAQKVTKEEIDTCDQVFKKKQAEHKLLEQDALEVKKAFEDKVVRNEIP